MTTSSWGETTGLTEAQAMMLGRRMLVSNLVAAVLTAGLLLASGLLGWRHWLLGLVIGTVYGNGFEYCYHRFLLHRPGSQLNANHMLHHTSFGQVEEALHVSFSCSPSAITFLILAHGLPLALLDRTMHTGIGAGIVIGYTLYFVLFEEMHWRIHLGKLPGWLEWMRRHHFAHHKGTHGAYNVFLPLFDRIFRSA